MVPSRSIGTVAAMSGVFTRILAAIDGSEPSNVAVTVAARLAREHGAQLVLCHCANWEPLIVQLQSIGAIVDPTPTIGAVKERGARVLAEAAGRAREFGVEVQSVVLQGDPPTGISALARETKSGLIVMGTHDGAGMQRLLIGSTTSAVLRRSTLPVLTVRPGIRVAPPVRRSFERILVATDDSALSAVAVETALAFPAEDRRELLFCSVADVDRVSAEIDREDPLAGSRLAAQAQTAVERALERARARGIAAQGRVLEGNPGAELVAAAERERVDLIVLGTHGRHGGERIALGSVAERIIRTAPLPVMIVGSGVRSRDDAAASANHQASLV